MNIVHAVPSMGESGGGPPRSVGQLCDHLVEGNSVHLMTAEDIEDPLVSLDSRIVTHFVKGENRTMVGRFRTSGFTEVLDRLNRKVPISICHQHGVWLRCSHDTTVYACKHNIPLVVAPRGMLETWALNHSKWKKKLAWALYQERDLKKATAFHATAESEAASIRSLGFKQPIAVIPNGIQLPERHRSSAITHPSSSKTALFLSRINPKKGLPMLLDAWRRIMPEEWRLVISGNDDSKHLPEVERKIHEYKLQDQVDLVGPLFGEAKDAAYRNADLFVLPSYSENFGIVVAEALSYGVPVLTTTGCPWQELHTNKCGWWVDPTDRGIEAGLRSAFKCSNDELAQMGFLGRKLVEEKYQWPGISERILNFYGWILNGGAKPDFVS